MGWLVIAVPIIGGLIGIYLGRGKNRTYKKHLSFQFQQFFNLLALSNKRNLKFEGVYDFLLVEKFLYSYRENQQYYFKLKTTDNRFEHLLPIYKPHEYNKRKEGELLSLGLVRHRIKQDRFISTFETEPIKAIQAVTQRAKLVLVLLFVVSSLLLFNLGLLGYIFFTN